MIHYMVQTTFTHGEDITSLTDTSLLLRKCRLEVTSDMLAWRILNHAQEHIDKQRNILLGREEVA